MALTIEEQQLVEQQYEDLIKSSKRVLSDEDIQLIRKAFDIANEAHSKMRRKTGEPYIIHPIAVAKIVASEIGLGRKAIAAALLHDVVEDTDYTVEDIEQMFGEKIASLVDGLTKISNILDQDGSKQVENFRRMLMTMSEDIRVIMIKLADRLHNMRTLDSMPEYKQIKIASETMNIYAPLAERLGLYSIKSELEDISLKFTQPGVYQEIASKFKDTEEERNKYIENFIKPLEAILKDAGINCTIKGRLKSIYSIWNKMVNKHVSFEEIYDLFAIRIVFDHSDDQTDDEAREECYRIMTLITNKYEYSESRIRDWVKKPKTNGYSALHITVMGPEGRWVEVQIRSRKMDDIAEHGIASHWKYKTGENNSDAKLESLIQSIQDTINNSESSFDFLDDFKLDIFTKEIHVFSPKGKIINLPKGATVIDFAYEIHSEVGNQAIAAKVNHKMATLSQVLHSGDQVEILTSTKQTPKLEWLNFAVAAKTKSNIKKALKADKAKEIQDGEHIFAKKMQELNVTLNHKQMKELREQFNVASNEEFFYHIALNQININSIAKFIPKVQKSSNILAKYWKLVLGKSNNGTQINHRDTFIINDDANKQQSFSFANCCNPIPGDEVVGYINPNNTVIVHKKGCSVLSDLASTHGERITAVEWESFKLKSFPVVIKIDGVDNLGLVYNVTKIISQESDVNIKSLKFETEGEVFTGEIKLFVHNKFDLDDLIRRIIRVPGVNKVSRIDEE